jgi:hypothetical protein
MLPPLDPDYLISVHDPAQLDEYAADLLQHLRALRKDEPTGGYGKGKIRAAADWLLARYAEARRPAPVNAVMLWYEVRDTKPTPRARTGPRVQERLLSAYIAAYLYDAAHAEAALYAVAKHAVVEYVRETGKQDWNQEAAEAAIRSWRRQRYYRDQVRWNRRPKG